MASKVSQLNPLGLFLLGYVKDKDIEVSISENRLKVNVSSVNLFKSPLEDLCKNVINIHIPFTKKSTTS